MCDRDYPAVCEYCSENPECCNCDPDECLADRARAFREGLYEL